MAIRTSTAVWEGTIKEGKGRIETESGAVKSVYSWHARFEDAPGTNPEELIGAAHAGCFSMALSDMLTGAGFQPEKIETTAKVHLGSRPEITKIELIAEARVPGISEEQFLDLATKAKEGCPVSRALSAVPTITLAAKLSA